ncbi:caspase family protein [Spirosoma aureum]|uniref:Caspase family protein n=1 Tax=Spirosoma aureum TaxID=2692134 RepID=A0A6G9ALE6_9BACT|nr:caspase family protein [Spirosoma aureum]QIP13105.1 caspase family protein [Spirosoma aureum]
MKLTILFFIGFLVVQSAQAQESEPGISTSRSSRQKINTQSFYAPETVNVPQITFQMGDGQSSTVQTDEIVVKACIKTSKPLTRLSLFVNDALQQASRELKVQSDGVLKECDQALSQTVQLREGDNRLKLVAQNEGGITSESFLIRYDKPAAIVAEKRLALVIGNADYPSSNRLTNPANDANDMAEALKNVGFEVMIHTNMDVRSMRRAIDEFGNKLKDYQVGLFYYAGHGVQSRGRNFLVPIDAKPESENEIEYDCFLADRILTKMEDARTRTNIVVLDACRDNPFERSWSRGGSENTGLTTMDAPVGSVIAYATSPGRTAADGNGRNGLYTAALLKALQVPDQPLTQLFQRVRAEVLKQSNNKQLPWESTSLTGDFYFRRK